jgi:hypothetical protein
MVRSLVSLFFAGALLLSGCRSLPDASPFADATVGLRNAVTMGGNAVVAELKRSPVEGMDAQASSLEQAWTGRTKAMAALVEYARSLQAITSAGENGAESVQKLATAAETLAQTLGAASFAAGSVGQLATDTLKFLGEQIIRARAARTLETALAEMQPAIDRIAELFAADLADLGAVIEVAIDSQRDRFADENQGPLFYRKQLLATQADLMKIIATDLKNGKSPTELARTDELRKVDDLLQAQAPWYAAYSDRQESIAARGRMSAELMGTIRIAFTEWAAAHAQLLAAIRTKRAPAAAELIETSHRIHDLVLRYRQL